MRAGRARVRPACARPAAWLTHAGYAQYVAALAPLGGAALLLQTEASLRAAGVAPHHVGPLLEKITAAAHAPPRVDAGGRAVANPARSARRCVTRDDDEQAATYLADGAASGGDAGLSSGVCDYDDDDE